jgi:alpha-amylase
MKVGNATRFKKFGVPVFGKPVGKFVCCLFAIAGLASLRPSASFGQAGVATPASPGTKQAYSVSEPVILQDFESSYVNIANKMPDVFEGGYGSIYLPPPGITLNGSSVGYDVFNRFDLGTPNQPTLYGTQNEFESVVQGIHGFGGSAYADLLWTWSNGIADNNNQAFEASGGYPGMTSYLQNTNPSAAGYNTQGYNNSYGDFYPSGDSNQDEEQVAGLNHIDPASNYEFIRLPTTAGNPQNIAAGTTPYDGLLSNIPTASNAQYYPSQSIVHTENDPTLGLTNAPIAQFNPANPMSGTPTATNALGYLMQYAQWMIQVMGVDGFRYDGGNNTYPWVQNYLDLATYNMSNRNLLNGQQEQIYSFSEVYNGSVSTVNQYVNLSGSNGNSSTVQGNRDAYDFPLYFAMTANLSAYNGSNGDSNNWNNVINADLSVQTTGYQDGAEGVKFVSEQDLPAPNFMQVAYAYILMLPGQAEVYYNGENFNNESFNSSGGEFPEGGAGDQQNAVMGAMGGFDDTNVQNSAYSNLNVTNLVDLHNRYGRGNYYTDYITNNLLAYERSVHNSTADEGTCLVMLSNDANPATSSVSFNVGFPAGTWLEEMTGNATSSYSDPNGNIPEFIQVQNNNTSGGYVNATFLNNATYQKGSTTSSYSTNDGFLIYALPTPTGTAAVSNVASIMAPQTKTYTAPGSFESNSNYSNGINRNASVDVIDADTTPSFTLSLNTVEANLPVTSTQVYHDQDADGDNAQFTIDGGTITVAANGVTSTTPGANGEITTPGNTSYGYQDFASSSPGYFNANGNGAYSQTIDTAGLSIGYHYIEVIAFRHNSNTSAPPVYSDWYETLYVDRGTPSASIGTVSSISSSEQQFNVQSDGTTSSEYVFLNLPASITSAQILNMVSTGNTKIGSTTYQGGLAGQTDSNLFAWGFNNLSGSNAGLQNGNDVATVASYRPDGNYSIQRLTQSQNPVLGFSNSVGLGLGDMNADGHINTTDVLDLEQNINSNGADFSPAGDFYGDGLNVLEDWYAFGNELQVNNQLPISNTYYITAAIMSYYDSVNPSVAQPAGSSLWTNSGGGTWSSTSNWTGSKIPQTAQQSVTFGPTNSAAATVTLDGAWTAGSVTFASSYSYTLAAGSNGSLTLNNGSSPAGINITFGIHTISAPVNLSNGATITTNTASNALTISGPISGAGGLTIQGPGTVTLSGANTYSGTTSVNSGELVLGNSGAFPDGGGLTIGTSTTTASVQLPVTPGVIQPSSFVINSGSTLDIGDSALVVPDGGSASAAEAEIQQYIANGVQSSGGAQIISSFAKSNGFDIAYADGSDPEAGDINLQAGELVVEPALAGDTDLNGTVNIHDLQDLLGNFGQSGFWDQGNFNGDATVDISDLQALLSNFNSSIVLSDSEMQNIEGIVGEFGDVAIPNSGGYGFTLVAIPEPASFGLLAFAGLAIMNRRPRRRTDWRI